MSTSNPSSQYLHRFRAHNTPTSFINPELSYIVLGALAFTHQ
jgi:hypothetical protein